MRRAATFALAGLLILAIGVVAAYRLGAFMRPSPKARYVGSAGCRDCHREFYRLWSRSRHGLAMQPFTPALAAEHLASPSEDIIAGGRRYRADMAAGRVRETSAEGETSYPIAHVLGGKNVYYFLTPYLRGRLQVLPVAYDVRRREWYDVAASGLRHFADVSEHAVDWTFPELTFNTSCYGCHVSQLASHYQRATDSYQSTWVEPGINCETCHGPGEEHIRRARQARPDDVRADPMLIAPRKLSHQQIVDLCASCHARLLPVADHFRPGDNYFDAFDLIGLEHRDFYPDGRDLGENYTLTAWRMSPCARSGRLDCLHCHTSSGRYRFPDRAHADQACLPCHAGVARDPLAHSHHAAGSTTCVDCHMPKTEFARMVRTDHSMRPPAPAATVALASPNACNLCHRDRNAAWSDRAVRAWYARDYQAAVLRPARLIAAARRGEFTELSAMLAAIAASERDEVTAVALLRLLGSCRSDEKWPAIVAATAAASPWVRAAAAEAAGDRLTPEAVPALLKLVRAPVRLPRVRAAQALAGLRSAAVPGDLRAELGAAIGELEAALVARSDDFASQYDLGRLLAARGDAGAAIGAYETALRLRPDMVAALVNVSILYNTVGRNADAEAALRRTLVLEPNNPAAQLNLGMLLGELGRLPEAEAALRAAAREDPASAAAAYNLAVVLSRDRPDEAVAWSRRASELDPASPKYAYTWAFYLAQRGDRRAAITVLRRALDGEAASTDAYLLLGKLLAQTGRAVEARTLFARAASEGRLPATERARFEALRVARAAGLGEPTNTNAGRR
jgi:tetratricopeptide (TPR) repeat protein